MAKKEKAQEAETIQQPVAQAVQSTAITVKPAAEQTMAERFAEQGVSPSVIKRALKAQHNLTLMENPRIPRVKAVSDGILLDPDSEDDPIKELTGVIIYAAKYKAFYLEKYDVANPNKKPPDCFSHDQINQRPDPSAANPQYKTCKGCPNNEFETAELGKGKACRDMRRLFLLTLDKDGSRAIMPLQINATPTSIKAFDDYLGKLVMHGLALNEVETKITAKKKNNKDTFVVLNFSKVRSYNEDVPEEKQILTDLGALTTVWLQHMERQHVEIDETEEAAAPDNPAPAAAQKGDY